jgi:ADP-heptose:LPS heptosyltransferase
MAWGRRPKAQVQPWRKRLERLGRRWLVRALGWILGAGRAPLAWPVRPKILVLRTDARLGNLILLTPVLATLRQRYPMAQIDVLAHPRGVAVLAGHPAVDHVLPYRKAALWHRHGPVATLWRLRRAAYDVCLEASNPTDPSATQLLLARLSGARLTVGAQQPGLDRLLHCAVDVRHAAAHEIAKRLAVLAPLPGRALCDTPSLGALPMLATSPVPQFVRTQLQAPYAVLNLGARLATKHLAAEDYAAVARVIAEAELVPVLSWGPAERQLAQQVAAYVPQARLAPPTDVAELAHLMRQARCVVSCDTGPMHLAVALGRPTCGLFVATDPARFGYAQPPHACCVVGHVPCATWLPQVAEFMAQRTVRASTRACAPA